MIYMRRQVSRAFEISKSWRARQVCVCVRERESLKLKLIRAGSWQLTSFIRSSYLLPALSLYFSCCCCYWCCLIWKDAGSSHFFLWSRMMNSFVNSSLSSVSAHFHTPTELNTPKSIQFQNGKTKFQLWNYLPRRRDIFPEIIKYLLPVTYPFSLQQCITCDYQHTRVKRHTIK
jgi:hypothetical protein